MDDFTTFSREDLDAKKAEVQASLDELFAIEGSPTDEQLAEAKSLGEQKVAIAAALDALDEAEKTTADEWASLKEQFSDEEPAPEDEGDESGDEDEDDEADEGDEGEKAEQPEAAAEVEVEPDKEPVVASAKKRSRASTVARKTRRPAPPAASEQPKVTITAAANTDYATGAKLDLEQVGLAIQSKVSGFPEPDESMRGRNDIPIQHFPIAKFNVDYPEDLTIGKGTDDMEVMAHAADESRLPEGSLVAAGGWCAPSETIYDLCEGETLEGLISLPEVGVKRGGINFTKGPNFGDFYGTPWSSGAGFKQTETQAIAGTDKVFYDITCPPFTEVRLDAVGLGIRVPILTDAAYPELTRRVTSGQLTAQEHRVSVDIINRIVTLTGAARVITGLGSSVADSLEGLTLLADERREQFRLGLSQSLEVILPFGTKEMFKSDLGRRVGAGVDPVTDAQLMAHFTARNLAVQFVYGWQPMSGFASPPAEVYPATYQALLYPAGTFVVGKKPVIKLNAIYDAASLVENLFTGLFTEQGILVAEMCYDSDLLTLPVCNAGRTGASDLDCS
jgi:hypothetical protein